MTISDADMDVADDVADAAVRDGEGVAAVVAMLVGVGDSRSAGLLTLIAVGDATALVLTKKRNTNRSATDRKYGDDSPLPCPSWLWTSIRPPSNSVISGVRQP